MLKQKKAAVEIQFHWIYVMLAGAALLIFFGTAIYQQQKLSGEKRERELLNSLEAAMRSVHAHPGLSERIDSRISLKIKCGTSSIMAGSASKQTGTDPIFSPEELKGMSLMMGTAKWNIPFRASDFLLIRTDEAFVILHDPANPESAGLFEKLKKEWPEGMPYSTVPHEKARIIALNTDYPAQYSGVRVIASKADNFEKGTIIFEGQAEDYAGFASVLGAAFSDSKENYDCSMKNAYRRLALVSEVYWKKAERLKQENPECSYEQAKNALNAIKTQAKLPDPDEAEIHSQAESLKAANNELLKQSCPVIY